ncbi:MAG: hypothetical protein ABSA42_02950 [Terracidiphilus sp.]|jgi:hypothetical protein
MKIANMHDAEKLNEAQQRRLYASCQYIDGLLCQLEQAFHQEDSLSPFPRYVNDLNPAQMNKLKDQIRRIREQLLETLAWQGMKPESPSIPTSRVALTSLTFIDMTIEELSPRHLRGCGAVPEGAIDGLNRVVRDLRFAAGAMESYLRKKIASREEELNEG